MSTRTQGIQTSGTSPVHSAYILASKLNRLILLSTMSKSTEVPEDSYITGSASNIMSDRALPARIFPNLTFRETREPTPAQEFREWQIHPRHLHFIWRNRVFQDNPEEDVTRPRWSGCWAFLSPLHEQRQAHCG